MSKTSDGVWGEPQFASANNQPTFSADLSLTSTFAAARGIRKFTSYAALLLATGMAADAYAMARDVPGALFRYDGASWVMEGIANFPTVSAANTAIGTPVAGMRRRIATKLYDEVYFGAPLSAWRPLGDGFIVPTTGSSGATVGLDGKVALVNAAAVALDNLFPADFEEFRLTIDVVLSTAVAFQINLRTSAPANESGANYDQHFMGANGASLSASSSQALTYWSFGGGTTRQFMELIISRPNIAVATEAMGRFYSTQNPQTAPQVGQYGFQHRSATAYAGLNLTLSGAGNITGTMHIEGIR